MRTSMPASPVISRISRMVSNTSRRSMPVELMPSSPVMWRIIRQARSRCWNPVVLPRNSFDLVIGSPIRPRSRPQFLRNLTDRDRHHLVAVRRVHAIVDREYFTLAIGKRDRSYIGAVFAQIHGPFQFRVRCSDLIGIGPFLAPKTIGGRGLHDTLDDAEVGSELIDLGLVQIGDR